MLATAMHERNLAENLFEVCLRLLRALAQELDGPVFALAEEAEEHVEQLVAGHTGHALELAFWRLRLRFL